MNSFLTEHSCRHIIFLNSDPIKVELTLTRDTVLAPCVFLIKRTNFNPERLTSFLQVMYFPLTPKDNIFDISMQYMSHFLYPMLNHYKIENISPVLNKKINEIKRLLVQGQGLEGFEKIHLSVHPVI